MLSSSTAFLAVKAWLKGSAMRLSVSMVMVYHCIRFARCHVSSSFRIVNEPSLEYPSDKSLSMQSLLEQIALLVFKALRGITPMHLQDLLQAKTPERYSLCSDALGLHKVSHTCKTSGDRAFAVAVPRFWNSRPLAIRERENDSIDNFKRNLKTPTG